jgi:glycosyltransferase involved in cell wall biosynthesis
MTAFPQPLVSIVTPVYNGAAYLAECIESVLAQTYSNWEYVIINNRSTDGTLALAEQYASREPRLRVITHPEFLPQFANWNAALRRMSPASAYCKVLHADDWLFPECVEKMVAIAEAHPSVGIVSAYRLEETQVSNTGLLPGAAVTPGREIGRRTLLGEFFLFGSPSSLLLRSRLVRAHDPFYNESILHADTDACYRLLQECDFGFVPQLLTFTRRHNESLTSLTRRLNTNTLSEIRCLLRYGPVFLSVTEFEARARAVRAGYDRYLARSLFELREAEFWNYQRRELAALGWPVSGWRLLRAALPELLDFREFTRLLRQGLARRRAARLTLPSAEKVLSGMVRPSPEHTAQ